jgi:hypothetical protein
MNYYLEEGNNDVCCCNITFLNECYVTSHNQSADEHCLKPHGIKIINTSSKLEQILDIKYLINRTLLAFHRSIQLKKLVERLHPELVFVAHKAFKPLQLTGNNNNKKEIP